MMTSKWASCLWLLFILQLGIILLGKLFIHHCPNELISNQMPVFSNYVPHFISGQWQKEWFERKDPREKENLATAQNF